MLEQTIKIKSYDVHPNGVVKISALQKYMQQIAREDSDSYGATYAKMREANMVFVITRLAVEFERPLRDEDIVTIRTINNRLEGASFVREFLFFSGGEQVAAATTLWALLDFEKRSILRPSALPFTIPALNLPVPGIPVQKRLTERGTVLTPSGERQVAFCARVSVRPLDQRPADRVSLGGAAGRHAGRRRAGTRERLSADGAQRPHRRQLL